MLKRLDWMFWLLIAIVLSRLFSMALVPMIDTTEARYGEVARLMAETGDWITPWFNYDVPFWGKPPLSFWSQALSFHLFGITEFAVRLPSWLANIGMLGLIYTLSRHLTDHRQALISTLIFATMALSFVMSGAVLTDPFLALGTTLAFVSIILTMSNPHSLWRWWFFVGLSIGLLAKGPLVLVLVGGPIFLWVLWRWQWHRVVRIPWLRGTLITALITLPWYIAAELKSPGFINYFIIGEHFLRFVDSGWQGDLYGTAHKEPFGTIWLHWIQASLPWGPIALVIVIKRWITSRQLNFFCKQELNDDQCLLLLAALFPSLFFTFSGNILWTYQLPALAPLSLLISMLIANSTTISKLKKTAFITTLAFVPFVLMFIGFYSYFYPDKLKNEKSLVAYYEQNKNPNTAPLIYIEKLPFSARFYSKGQVIQMTLPELKSLLARRNNATYFVVSSNNNLNEVISSLPAQVTVEFRNRRFTLLKNIINKSR